MTNEEKAAARVKLAELANEIERFSLTIADAKRAVNGLRKEQAALKTALRQSEKDARQPAEG